MKKSEYFEIVWSEALKKIDEVGPIEVFDYVEEIMRKSQPKIEQILDKKVAKNILEKKDQARKSIAGNTFQSLILELLKINQKQSNLPAHITIAKTKKNKIIKQHATIYVGAETQKPDIDLLIHDDKTLIVYSCKTSLRERAGQTYKWKLLLDIYHHCPHLVKKYDLQYKKDMEILTGFITPNFYNEINQPQQRGMLKFFDYAYIGKRVESDIIKPLSSIIDDLNKVFS